MKLKLLAPFRTDFSVITEVPTLAPDRYAKYWDAISARKKQLQAKLAGVAALSDEVNEIRFAHTSKLRRSPFNRYQSLRSDSLERTVHVLEMDLPGSALVWNPAANGNTLRAALVAGLDRIVCRVFDHEISLLEADFDLGDRFQSSGAEHIPEALDQLQEEAIKLGEKLAFLCANNLLQPTFEWIRRAPSDSGEVVERSSGNAGQAAGGEVLWVTRTLMLDPADVGNRDAIIRHWLKDSGGAERKNDKSLADQVIDGDRDHLTQWLNYLYISAGTAPPRNGGSHLAAPFCDSWEAMLHAQYFYAALDVVDLHLTSILAESFSPGNDQKIGELKKRLAQNIRKANLLLLQLHDNSKYYKRTVKAELDEILEYWDFEKVLIRPVQNKIDLCKERLTFLHEQVAEKSAFYTDGILMAIGITAIFSTVLAFVEYGRTMANDADLASYDLTSRWKVIDLIAAQPTDVILVISGLISLILVIVYFYFRGQQKV